MQIIGASFSKSHHITILSYYLRKVILAIIFLFTFKQNISKCYRIKRIYSSEKRISWLPYLSTATTTLWELVSPMDSWILAICFQSTFPPTSTHKRESLHLERNSVKNTLRVLKHISEISYFPYKRNNDLGEQFVWHQWPLSRPNVLNEL